MNEIKELNIGDKILIRAEIVDKSLDARRVNLGHGTCQVWMRNDYLLSNIIQDIDWIPCTDRLPDTLENVMIQLKGKHIENQYAPRVGYYKGNNEWCIFVNPDTNPYLLPSPHEVIAWMPLPEQYVVPKQSDIFSEAGYGDDVCECARRICEKHNITKESVLDLLKLLKLINC